MMVTCTKHVQCIDIHIRNFENFSHYFLKHFKIAMQLYQLYCHVTSGLKEIRPTELVMQNEGKHRSRYNFLFIFRKLSGIK